MPSKSPRIRKNKHKLTTNQKLTVSVIFMRFIADSFLLRRMVTTQMTRGRAATQKLYRCNAKESDATQTTCVCVVLSTASSNRFTACATQTTQTLQRKKSTRTVFGG